MKNFSIVILLLLTSCSTVIISRETVEDVTQMQEVESHEYAQ